MIAGAFICFVCAAVCCWCAWTARGLYACPMALFLAACYLSLGILVVAQ